MLYYVSNLCVVSLDWEVYMTKWWYLNQEESQDKYIYKQNLVILDDFSFGPTILENSTKRRENDRIQIKMHELDTKQNENAKQNKTKKVTFNLSF